MGKLSRKLSRVLGGARKKAAPAPKEKATVATKTDAADRVERIVVKKPDFSVEPLPPSRDDRKVTLREVCAIMGISVPAEYESMADTVFSEVCGVTKFCKPGAILFDQSLNKDTCQKIALQGHQRGAIFFVSQHPVYDAEGNRLPGIVCNYVSGHLVRVCRAIRNSLDITSIAVTGSVGKTTTKDVLASVIGAQCKIFANKGNSNGLGPIVHHVQVMDPDCDVLLQEAGMTYKGTISAAGKVIKPNAFVVTNIGESHIELYENKEGIFKEKLSLDDCAVDGAKAFLNYDDPMLASAELKSDVVSFAIDRTDVDYYAANITEANGIISFDLVETATGFTMRGEMNAFGRHNAYGAVCAFAVGRWLGIDPENIAKGLKSYSSKGLRQSLKTIGDRKVFVDCYNSSEIAIKSVSQALTMIEPRPGGRRVLCCAPVASLGDISEETHRRIGSYLATVEGIDELVFFGDLTAYSAAEARKAGAKNVFYTIDREELNTYLEKTLQPEDVICFKGSRKYLLERTIDYLFGTALVLEDQERLSPKHTETIEEPNGSYRVIPEYGIEYFAYPLREPVTVSEKNKCRDLGTDRGLTDSQIEEIQHVRIPSTYKDEKVCIVGRKAFYKAQNVKSVEIEEGVYAIARDAFRQAGDLRSVVLPSSLRVIYEDAFRECEKLSELVVPEGVTTIEPRAFAQCPALEDLYLPASLKAIAESILRETENVTVHCPQGSYAAAFVAENYPNLKLVCDMDS